MAELQITVKRMKVPSANFPKADLRVGPYSRYEFKCLSCCEVLFAPLGWIIDTGYCINKIDPAILTAIDDQFSSPTAEVPHSKQHNVVRCNSCEAIYIVYVKIDETSIGAYRAMISSVDQCLIVES